MPQVTSASEMAGMEKRNVFPPKEAVWFVNKSDVECGSGKTKLLENSGFAYLQSNLLQIFAGCHVQSVTKPTQHTNLSVYSSLLNQIWGIWV